MAGNTIIPRLLEESITFKEAFKDPRFEGSITVGGNLDVTQPSGAGTTGGVRVRVNADGNAYFEVTNPTGDTQLFLLSFKSGLMTTSGMITTTRAAVDLKNDFLSASPGAFIAADGFWNAQLPIAMVDAATIDYDLKTGINFKVTLRGNRTLNVPSNLKIGQKGYIRISQDDTGGRTLSYATGYRFEDNVTPPNLNSQIFAITVLRYEVTADGEVTISGGKGNTPVIVEATAAEYRQAVPGKLLTPSKAWEAAQVQTIAETDIVNGVDFRNFINATVTLTDNRMMANPVAAGMKPGQSGVITFIMGGAGNYALTFGDQWWVTDGVIPTMTGSAGSVNRMFYTVTSTATVDFFFAKNMGRTYDSDATAYFTAMTVQPTAQRKALINAFVVGLKADGVWNLLDNLWLLASHDEQSSRVNLIRPTKSLAKSGTPWFVVDRGWQQTGTAGNNGYNQLLTPDAYFGASLKRNTIHSLSYGIWQNTNFAETANGYLCGENTNSFYDYMLCNNTSTSGRIASSTATINSGQVKGLKAVSHVTGDTNMYVFQNTDNTTATYQTLTNNSSAPFVLLNAGSSTTYPGTNNRQAAGFTGAGMSVAQMASMYNRLNTYLTAIGAN